MAEHLLTRVVPQEPSEALVAVDDPAVPVIPQDAGEVAIEKEAVALFGDLGCPAARLRYTAERYVLEQRPDQLADRFEDDDPPFREVPTLLPPDEVERAGHGAVDGQRDDQAGPVGEDAKQRKREPRIVLHVVAPDHVPRREHARGEALGRERQRRLREEL